MLFVNQRESHILAITYAFMPPRKIVPKIDYEVNYGLFEPDNFPGAESRHMVLAQPIDHTNILIKYEPMELVE